MFTFPESGVAPGVYIREIDRPGPIAGVGTSIAAIIGPAQKGPIGVPTRVTNPTRFEDAFGSYISAPPVYSTHAAHGFFANGGSQLYFVRVGTAKRASLPLDDTNGAVTLVATAKEEGVAAHQITVQVAAATAPSTTPEVVKESATIAGGGVSGTTVEVDDATGFAPGDVVLFDDGGSTESATLAGTDVAAKELELTGALTGTFGVGNTVRIADLPVGRTKIRVSGASNFHQGSYVSIADGTNTETKVVAAVEPVNGVLTLSSGLANAFSLDAADPDVTVTPLDFKLTVKHPDEASPETFDNLAMDPRHPRFYGAVVDSQWIDLAGPEPPNTTAPPANRPANAGPSPLAGGADDDLNNIPDSAYTDALKALEKVDEVTLVMIPDRTKKAIQQELVLHCETMQDRFAILDPDPAASSIEAQMNDVRSERGYAALYYPRIVVRNPLADGEIAIPPSGHVAGLYARIDSERGVHKAPANETLRGVIGLTEILNDADQAPLNDAGINVIRSFVGRGIRVWGARTTAPTSQTQWRYLNVRRLMLFIEESIQEGTQSAVFEPNNQALWETLKRQVNGFLNRVWRSGALVGTKPEQAYRVRIDEELNPPEVRALGQLRIEVRVAPTTPAEFIVFFITHQPGEPIIDE